MSNLLRGATLDSARRRKDKSVSLTFITSTEQDSNQFIEIDKLLDSSGTLFFKDSENISKEELDTLEASKIDVKPKGKSNSQQLRSVLYVYWDQITPPHNLKTIGNFNEFYDSEMKRIIQHYKDKLD